MSFELNSELDLDKISPQYALKNRLLIKNILQDQSANRLSKLLLDFPEWNLVFRLNNKHYDVSEQGFYHMPEHERQNIETQIKKYALNNFGYMYCNYPVYDLVQVNKCDAVLDDFYRFLNTAGFRRFLSEITGFENIDFLDSQATAYKNGHFLSSHDDAVAGKNRLAAYVFNLSPQWDSQWGGNLVFYDDQGNVEDTYLPVFNSLSLFNVGKQHAVELVEIQARQTRFSITGWLRFK